MNADGRTIADHRARHTLHTLLFATALCGAMLAARCFYAGTLHFAYLFGNLILAWIPMVLALCVRHLSRFEPQRRVLFWGCLLGWVLFFPNAPYIVTDMIHLKEFGADGIPKWFDMMLTMTSASAGLFLGCLSLYLMQLLVRERLGWRIGWAFGMGMLALSSLGIYLGRFLRLNSWDAILRPLLLAEQIAGLHRSAAQVLAFSATFFFFSVAAYSFVVSVARLHDREG